MFDNSKWYSFNFIKSFTFDDNSFDAFRWTFLDMGIKSVTLAGVFARLMIGFELLIGFFLLFHIFLKQFTYKILIAVLVLFIIYLFYVLKVQGNNVNCGCFGDKVTMNPINAIWKNVILIAITFLLIYIYPSSPYKGQEWLSAFVGMIALVLPFVVAPLKGDVDTPIVVSSAVNLNPLYQSSQPPPVELRTGKHIVAFMSLTCHHCKKAAGLLNIIHKEHPGIPIFMILGGSEDNLKSFFAESHAESVPNMYFKDTKILTQISGNALPAIFWIENSVIKYKSSYYQLDPKLMEQWSK